MNNQDIDEPLHSWNEVLGEPQLEFDDTEIKNSITLANDFSNHDELNFDLSKDISNDLDSQSLQFFEENFEDQLSNKEFCNNDSNDTVNYSYKDMEDLNIINVAGDDKIGRKIITVSACNLPPKEALNYKEFLHYIIQTLDKFVENDYTLVYFHYGLNSGNKPSISWLWQAYKLLDRKFKKNLKQLYIVHPSSFIKILYQIFKPALSSKFGEKIIYTNNLNELINLLQTHQIYIPEPVKCYDRSLNHITKTDKISISGNVKTINPFPPQLFGIDIEDLSKCHKEPIPSQIQQIVSILSNNDKISTEGIFRRSCNFKKLENVKFKLNNGLSLSKEDAKDTHLLAVLLKCFLRELPFPLLTFDVYDVITQTERSLIDPVFCQRLINSIPNQNRLLLSFLLEFLNRVAINFNSNKMTSTNLGIVFGPNLLWKPNHASIHSIELINYFVSTLIDNYTIIFGAN